MDQFSHDLTVALEETSLLDRARVSRWGQRRRTRSTGNLPCAPQPTEDSSSSPTDTGTQTVQISKNVDSLASNHLGIMISVDDDDEKTAVRLPCHLQNSAAIRLGALESDSLNEALSPARFFKPSARKKRKLKRMAVESELNGIQLNDDAPESPLAPAGCIRKRVLKPDTNNYRSNMFFCGKRKRSNRDRYHIGGADQSKLHSTSMPRHSYMDDYRMRPRSFSSTSKPHSDRLLPLNKGLLSKIERISQKLKTEVIALPSPETADGLAQVDVSDVALISAAVISTKGTPTGMSGCAIPSTTVKVAVTAEAAAFLGHRKSCGSSGSRRRTQLQQLQFAVDQHPMDCGELNDFLSSSSLSSSESDDVHTANDTDREGDDELTDWPGNEGVGGFSDGKYDPKRKLTKKSNFQQIGCKVDDSNTGLMLAEDDTLMLTSFDVHEPIEKRYQPSQPIAIAGKSFGFSSVGGGSADIRERCSGGVAGGKGVGDVGSMKDYISIPLKQIESEMSGETSNPFLASPPYAPEEVREIRAGCRRIKERPGFTIKTSVNERLARFLQDPRQLQIRLPDIEIYEHESLLSLATLYSLQMSVDNGCAVLTKTSNTTQSVSIEHQSLQNRLLLSDFKRRCYDNKGNVIPHK